VKGPVIIECGSQILLDLEQGWDSWWTSQRAVGSPDLLKRHHPSEMGRGFIPLPEITRKAAKYNVSITAPEAVLGGMDLIDPGFRRKGIKDGRERQDSTLTTLPSKVNASFL